MEHVCGVLVYCIRLSEELKESKGTELFDCKYWSKVISKFSIIV